jgi:hypothetical protein
MNVRFKSYLVLLATFALGVTVGLLGSQAMNRAAFRSMDWGQHGPRHADREHAAPFSKKLGKRLEKRIDSIAAPTAEQKERIRPILLRFEENLRGQFQERRRAAKLMMDSLDAELATVLSPEQMTKWRERPHRRFRPHRE